jgi:hypothetical protein
MASGDLFKDGEGRSNPLEIVYINNNWIVIYSEQDWFKIYVYKEGCIYEVDKKKWLFESDHGLANHIYFTIEKFNLDHIANRNNQNEYIQNTFTS